MTVKELMHDLADIIKNYKNAAEWEVHIEIGGECEGKEYKELETKIFPRGGILYIFDIDEA